MPTITPDDAFLQHEIEQLAVKAGRIILKADQSAGGGIDHSTNHNIDHNGEGFTVARKSGRPTAVKEFLAAYQK